MAGDGPIDLLSLGGDPGRRGGWRGFGRMVLLGVVGALALIGLVAATLR